MSTQVRLGLAGVAVLAVGALALYVASKKKPGESMGAAAGRVIVSAAGDAAVGGVKAIGAQVGIPDTDQAQCDKDLANGDYLAASFSCPATNFVSAATAGAFFNAAALPQAVNQAANKYTTAGNFSSQSAIEQSFNTPDPGNQWAGGG